MNGKPGRFKPCLHCGTPFWCVPSRDTGTDIERKFCSFVCTKAYDRAQSPARFWAKVDKHGTNGCWVWTGYTQKFGHGTIFRADGSGKAKTVLAHRYAWELLNGPLPEDKFLLHNCDNPPCVNPAHLYIGDRKDNALDMAKRARSTWGERSVHHKLTAEQVREIRKRFRKYGPYQQSRTNATELASEYGIKDGAILDIIAGRSWAHLDVGESP